jgi:peptide/nickel transport system ATP-binding protein
MTALLDLREISIAVRGGVTLVERASLRVRPGEAVGLVGESGSGKSMTAFAIMGLFPSPDIRVTEGRIWLDGQDLRALGPAAMRRVRGARIGMVFQDPSAYLDPLMRVGDQVAEALVVHGQGAEAATRVPRLLAQVELPAALARRYPHELSGGQRQRVLIAAALAMRPRLLIADEPTTALDATVQAEILDLLQRLQAELGLGVLLISHDLAVVAQRCQHVAVMYAGQIVEQGPASALFAAPRHPYTQGLVLSTLTTEADARRLFSIPGRVPAATAWPSGCRFHPRCPASLPDPCETLRPALMMRDEGRSDRCWRSAVTLQAWADAS